MYKLKNSTSKNSFLLTCFLLLSSCGIQKIVSKTTDKNSPIIETVPAPTPITPFRVSQIRASNNFTCAEKKESNSNNNSIYCWGQNESGQLGNTTGSNTLSTPVELKGLIGESQSLALGNSFGCWLSKAFDLRCWGKNDQGQLGNSAVTSSREPLSVIDPYPDLVDMITTSGMTTCALTNKGVIQCWGQNFTNALGTTIATNTISSQPIFIQTSLLAPDDKFIKINTSGNISNLSSSNAALTIQGRVFCWGSNTFGTCGMGNTTTSLPFSSPAIPGNALVKDMVVNRFSLFVITTNNTFLTSGSNFFGQLGIGNTTNQTTLIPVSVVSGSSVRSLPTGQSSASMCIITTSGTIKCWGLNNAGQMGNNTVTAPQLVAQDVLDATGSPLSGAVQLGLQSAGACALKNDGSVWCWGGNNVGQLGINSTTQSNVATNTLFTKKVKNISTGHSHSCAILEDNTLQCWGLGTNGRLGTNSTANALIPTTISGLAGTPLSLTLGEVNTCVLLESRLIQCWGGNSTGVLGDNDISLNRLRPLNILPYYSGNGAITNVATGGAHTCILANDVPKCFGWNADGQLGIGTNTNSSSPNYVLGLPVGISQMSLGEKFSCFLGRNSLVYCTGDNSFGQIGMGGKLRQTSPVLVSQLQNVTELSAGRNHACAITQSGVGYCWGDNRYGQLGDGTVVMREVPQLIKGLKENITKISSGRNHTCALTASQKVLCWGYNYKGQLGTSNFIDKVTPTPIVVSSDINFTNVSAGDEHTCAQTTDNKMYCWGSNDFGQLGMSAASSAPSLVPNP